MTEPDLVRRLTTIMDIDVVGFSTMSARDEEHALGLLGDRMATAQTLVKHHRGRVFKLTGDGLLAEFASPVEAVRAALEIQEAMRAANGQAGPDNQLVLRIGVNLGDVVESGDDLMGDAVNVAARLELIATPGGICVSAAVYEQIEGKLTLGAEDLGEQHVKNIPRAIHAYRLTLGRPPPPVTAAPPPAGGRKATRLAVIIGAAAVRCRPGDRRRLAAARALAAGADLDSRGPGARARPRRVGDATGSPDGADAACSATGCRTIRGPSACGRAAAGRGSCRCAAANGASAVRCLGGSVRAAMARAASRGLRHGRGRQGHGDQRPWLVRHGHAHARRAGGPAPRPRRVQRARRARGADHT